MNEFMRRPYSILLDKAENKEYPKTGNSSTIKTDGQLAVGLEVVVPTCQGVPIQKGLECQSFNSILFHSFVFYFAFNKHLANFCAGFLREYRLNIWFNRLWKYDSRSFHNIPVFIALPFIMHCRPQVLKDQMAVKSQLGWKLLWGSSFAWKKKCWRRSKTNPAKERGRIQKSRNECKVGFCCQEGILDEEF